MCRKSEYQKISMNTTTITIGKRGTLVLPVKMRKDFGFDEGKNVLIESTTDGILIRPVFSVPIEMYSKDRKAEFLLNNAVTFDEYQQLRDEVVSMGIDPDSIPHTPPPK